MKSLYRYRILTLLAGIVTAAVIVFSQLFYFQAATYCQKKAETTQHSKKEGAKENYISIPSSTISSTSTIDLNQSVLFVLETLFEDEGDQQTTQQVEVPVNRLFQTLFRFIVSPNAP